MKLPPEKAARVKEAKEHLEALVNERKHRPNGENRHPVDRRIPDELTRYIFDLGQYRLQESSSIEYHRKAIEQAQENERELTEMLRGLQQEYNIACNTDSFLFTAAAQWPPVAPPAPPVPGAYPCPPNS